MWIVHFADDQHIPRSALLLIPSGFHGFVLSDGCKRSGFLTLRRLRAHAAMCALGIDKLRQHPAKILLLWRHGEQNALGAHVSVKSLDIGDSESQLDFSRWILVGSRV